MQYHALHLMIPSFTFLKGTFWLGMAIIGNGLWIYFAWTIYNPLFRFSLMFPNLVYGSVEHIFYTPLALITELRNSFGMSQQQLRSTSIHLAKVQHNPCKEDICYVQRNVECALTLNLTSSLLTDAPNSSLQPIGLCYAVILIKSKVGIQFSIS